MSVASLRQEPAEERQEKPLSGRDSSTTSSGSDTSSNASTSSISDAEQEKDQHEENPFVDTPTSGIFQEEQKAQLGARISPTDETGNFEGRSVQ